MKLVISLIGFIFAAQVHAQELVKSAAAPASKNSALPYCVDDSAKIEEIKTTISNNKKNQFKYKGYREALHAQSDVEIMARLVYAETVGANCPEHNQKVVQGIAAVIGNRMRIRKGNVRSVVFERDQFASSLNIYTESKYLDFLCPKDTALWQAALKESGIALSNAKLELDPKTVQYFLYKHSPRWKKEPASWKDYKQDVSGGASEIESCVKFFKNKGWG